MTIAICIFCGEEKFGALVPCESCGGVPTHNADEMARAMLFTEHFMNINGLALMSKIIKHGEDPIRHIPELKQYYDTQYDKFSDAQGNIDYDKLKNIALNSINQKEAEKETPRARFDKNKMEFE